TFAAFFAAWPLFAASAVSGMETSALVTALLGAAALVERRHWASGLSLALVALMRPEGAAAAAVLAIAAGWRDRAIAAGIVAATWAGLAAYYGSFIPQSVLAKASLY